MCKIYNFEGKCSGNCYLKMHLTPHMYKIVILKAIAKEIVTFKMHLTPNMYIIITLKANVQQIFTLKCIWHHIYTKSLLWRQMLRKLLLEHVFDSKYVQNMLVWRQMQRRNCCCKMHLLPNMYKLITLKANVKEIVTWNCFWCQMCTK